MNRMSIGKMGLAVMGGLIALAPSVVSAQGFGGGGMPPAIAAKIKAWQKYRDQHKNVSNLQTMLYEVAQTDKDPATQLNKAQAAKMLTIYKGYASKPSLSEDQAKEVSKQIGGLMTEKQLKKMTMSTPPWMRGGGGGGFGGGGGRPGGGGGRPAGGGGRPGGFTFPDPPAGSYNPMNPDTLPFVQMRPQAKQSQSAFLASLQTRK